MKQTFNRVRKAGACNGKFIPQDMSMRTSTRLKVSNPLLQLTNYISSPHTKYTHKLIDRIGKPPYTSL